MKEMVLGSTRNQPGLDMKAGLKEWPHALPLIFLPCDQGLRHSLQIGLLGLGIKLCSPFSSQHPGLASAAQTPPWVPFVFRIKIWAFLHREPFTPKFADLAKSTHPISLSYTWHFHETEPLTFTGTSFSTFLLKLEPLPRDPSPHIHKFLQILKTQLNPLAFSNPQAIFSTRLLIIPGLCPSLHLSHCKMLYSSHHLQCSLWARHSVNSQLSFAQVALKWIREGTFSNLGTALHSCYYVVCHEMMFHGVPTLLLFIFVPDCPFKTVCVANKPGR